MKNINEFLAAFNKEYQFLYDSEDYVAGYSEAVETFDELIKTKEEFKSFVIEFAQFRQDFISSDREAAAFMFALEAMET